MDDRLYRFGIHAALVTSLILFALLLNLRIMTAQANQSEPEIPERPQTAKEPAADKTTKETGEGWVNKLAEKLATPLGKRPTALIAAPTLYVVDSAGRIIGRADSLGIYNLPLLSGSEAIVDWDRRILTDETALDALKLLRIVAEYEELAPLISGIRVHRDQIVAYFNFGRTIPVIFGYGNWEQKVVNLVEYYRQLGADDLTRRARHLDLRVDGRILVKRNG